MVHVKTSFTESHGTYGSPRLTDALDDKGISVGRHRVARLMREAGNQASKPKLYNATTDSKHLSPIAPNLIKRQFNEVGAAPKKHWVTDITYIWTWLGWLYLCVFIDVFSRKVVGWSIDDTMETRIILDALNMAVARRNPGTGLIGHSDIGSKYASYS